MSNTMIRRLVGGVGTALIFLICGVVIAAHFLTGRNLQRIDVSEYTTVQSDGSGGYIAELDVDRLITEQRLHNPTELEIDDYPEIAAIRGLSVRVTPQGDAFELETVTMGEDPTALLKRHGIRLINTVWTVTRAELDGSGEAETPSRKDKLVFSDYVVTVRTDNGFDAKLDLVRLLTDAGFDPSADPSSSIGMRALSSLDVACQQTAEGYRLQTTSTLPSVMDDLKAAGITVTHTQWTWTAREMEAHVGTITTLEPQAPETEQPTPPETHETPNPTDAPETDEPTAVPETPAPETPAPTRSADAIDTLYGFDQTEVRKAIRAAKEQKYGSSIEASEVKYNYFAVGSSTTEHGNVFRLVYKITTSSGTEYLIADVYDLESETGYAASDVKLSVESSSTKARSTDDLKDYKVYTLTGGSMVFAENKDKSPFDKDGLVMAKSLTESVSYDELWDIPQTDDLTLLQLLGYARNEMFARGGHKFGDSSNYLKYFKQFSWYKPTGSVSADALAEKYPATKKNITTIKFLEKLIKEG